MIRSCNKMECDKCYGVPIILIAKKFKCKSCGKEAEGDFKQNYCNECSLKQKICRGCGDKLES